MPLRTDEKNDSATLSVLVHELASELMAQLYFTHSDITSPEAGWDLRGYQPLLTRALPYLRGDDKKLVTKLLKTIELALKD